MLAQLAQAVTGSLDPSDVLNRVAQAASGLLADSSARIWTVEDDRLVLRAEAGTVGPPRGGRKTEFVFAEGLTGHVAHTQAPLVVDDVLADPRVVNIDWMRQQGYVSFIGLPLRVRDRLVGVLALLTRRRHHFVADELELLTSFGTQAAIAIQNAGLYTEAERRRRAAEALAEVGRLISQSLDLGEVVQRIADSVRRLLNGCAASLYRVEPASGDLAALAVSGDPGPAFDRTIVFPRGTGVAGLAVRRHQPVVTPNLLTDASVTLTPELRARIEAAPYRAVLAVPLLIHDRVIGALGVGDRLGRIFTDDEMRLAQAFADQAAVALENARLFEEQARLLQVLRARQARLEALLEVTREVARLQPLEALFARVAETCGRLLGADSVGIRVVDGDDLVLAGTWGDAREVMATPRLKIGESLSGLVAATGTPLLVADPANDARLLPAHRQALRRLGYDALLVVPVLLVEQVVGVLSVHARQRGGFSSEDLSIVTAFAAQVAMALENHRLYHEARSAYEELSHTQDQLLQAQKTEAIGRLAGGIAHDFNNLLTVIIGRTQLLQRQLAPGAPLFQDINLISHTAERAADLTRQLLAFSRRQVLQPKALRLNAVVAGLVPMLKRLIGEDVELLTVLDPALGPVKADVGQLEQVIMNLAINARDAMPTGGRLTLETASITLDGAYARRHVEVSPGPYVMLAVSDTGIGMDAETRARLFEPYFTTKGPGKGTGLGLATVHGIVKQSGGHIWVYSEPGRGTTFKIYLPPIDEVAEGVVPGTTPVLGPRGAETILLVEDEDAVRALARDILREKGYTVLEAARGIEAVLVSAQHPGPIDLLLTDVVMPEMSGRVLADRLAPARSEMKVLYMSGYTDNAVVHHDVLDAGTAYLQKPFTPDNLARKVRQILDGGTQLNVVQ